MPVSLSEDVDLVSEPLSRLSLSPGHVSVVPGAHHAVGAVPLHLPVYSDHAVLFDNRIASLGFTRSPTQRETPANGDCFFAAALDQLFNVGIGNTEELDIENDVKFTRQWLTLEMRRSWKRGKLSSDLMFLESSESANPEEYLSRMGQQGVFADNLAIQFFASLVRHDIIIVHANHGTAARGQDYTWIKGIPYLQYTIFTPTDNDVYRWRVILWCSG